MDNNPLVLNLSDFIKQIQELPMVRMGEFDTILQKISERGWSCYEYLDKVEETLSKLDIGERLQLKEDLVKLSEQVTPLLDLLDSIRYGSKWMYRVQDMLTNMEQTILKYTKYLSN